MKAKRKFQLIGYCPGCKEEIYYDWDNVTCVSYCSCSFHTNCDQLLKKNQEERDYDPS
jgi:hypothetical protein